MNADAVVENARRKLAARRTRRQAWIGLAAACFALAVSAHFYLAGLYTTGLGEVRRWQLPDGTTMELDARSRVRCDFTSTARVVHLQDGGALFQVAGDARPFEVRVGSATIRDIGTTFDVHLGSSTEPEVQVAVAEGLVELRPADGTAAIRIGAGEQLTWSAGRPGNQPTQLATGIFGSWREGRFVYRDRPLRIRDQ